MLARYFLICETGNTFILTTAMTKSFGDIFIYKICILIIVDRQRLFVNAQEKSYNSAL